MTESELHDKTPGGGGVVPDSRMLVTVSTLSLLLICVLSLLTSGLMGCMFMVAVVSTTNIPEVTKYQCSQLSVLGLTVYSAQQRGCGRGVAAAALRWWLPSAPPRTRWCARVEADHVLVPAQVNMADMSDMLYSISIPNIDHHC